MPFDGRRAQGHGKGGWGPAGGGGPGGGRPADDAGGMGTSGGRRKRKADRGTGLKADMVKTTICRNWQKGTCQFGMECGFAHGEADLRVGGAVSPQPEVPPPQPRGGALSSSSDSPREGSELRPRVRCAASSPPWPEPPPPPPSPQGGSPRPQAQAPAPAAQRPQAQAQPQLQGTAAADVSAALRQQQFMLMQQALYGPGLYGQGVASAPLLQDQWLGRLPYGLDAQQPPGAAGLFSAAMCDPLQQQQQQQLSSSQQFGRRSTRGGKGRRSSASDARSFQFTPMAAAAAEQLGVIQDGTIGDDSTFAGSFASMGTTAAFSAGSARLAATAPLDGFSGGGLSTNSTTGPVGLAATAPSADSLSGNSELMTLVLKEKRTKGVVVRAGCGSMMSPVGVIGVAGVGLFSFTYASVKNAAYSRMTVGCRVDCRLSQTHPPRAVSVRLLSDVKHGEAKEEEVEELVGTLLEARRNYSGVELGPKDGPQGFPTPEIMPLAYTAGLGAFETEESRTPDHKQLSRARSLPVQTNIRSFVLSDPPLSDPQHRGVGSEETRETPCTTDAAGSTQQTSVTILSKGTGSPSTSPVQFVDLPDPEDEVAACQAAVAAAVGICTFVCGSVAKSGQNTEDCIEELVRALANVQGPATVSHKERV
eukprot:Hpha_TRINITY_DN12679_c0_g1::TRINITY_DN12679_c0_g1_i1::g.49490::m.49490